MWRIAVGLLAGSCVLLRLPELPGAAMMGWMVLLGVLLAAIVREPGFLAFAAGACLCWLQLDHRLDDRLARQLEGQDLRVRGVVTSIPYPVADGLRFRFEPSATLEGLPARLQLIWYEYEWVPKAGESLIVEARLRRPRGFANPGGSDYAAQLLRNGIGATGYIRSAARLGRDPREFWSRPFLVARGNIAERIVRLLGDRPGTGIVLGLSVGLKGRISRQQWLALSGSGTSHLMAISGMHIGAIAGLFALLAGRVQRSRLARGAGTGRRDIACVAGLSAALLYAALAGWALPVRRALAMLAVAGAALVTRRNVSPTSGLALAAILVLLLDPLAPMTPGFWLSFTAVACLLFSSGGYVHGLGGLRAFLTAQAAVVIGLVPVLAAVFGRIPVVAGLVNLLAIPLYTMLVVPLVLFSVLAGVLWEPLGGWLLPVVASLIEITWPLFELPSQWPLANWHVAALPAPLWVVLLVGVVAALAPLPRRARLAGFLMVIAACCWRPAAPPAGALRFALLDVGQGLAAIIRTRRHLLVYDTGPSFRSGNDTGRMVVAPYLRHHGLSRIDMLVVSHDDDDHAGGANTLLDEFEVKRLVSSTSITGLRESDGTCRAGHAWTWDGVRFDWLHPGDEAEHRDNDFSCVLRVATAHRVLLLPGDIESRAERRILANAAPGSVDVLVAPHHGSKTSSSARFVAGTTPEWVLFASGHRNRWGFPADAVVDRWQAAGAKTLTTAVSGAIEVEFGPTTLRPTPRAWRAHNRRAWIED